MSSASTDKAFSDPQEARTARNREWSEFMRSLVERNRTAVINIAVMAPTLGYKSKSVLQRHLDPESDYSLPIADVDAMPEVIALGAASKLAARHGHALVKLPAALTVVGAIEAIAKIQIESGEATLEAARALADGRLDRGEAVKLLRELDEMISAALTIRAWCERALIEGVVNVDGGAA